MRTTIISDKFSDLQNKGYKQFNTFSKSNKIGAHVCSLPVSIADIGSDILSTFLHSIEQIVMTAINLLGAAFASSSGYSLIDALYCTEEAATSIVKLPILMALAPFKILLQVYYINKAHSPISFNTQYQY